MGVPLMRTKTWAYATGAFFGGVAGAYYASYKSGAFPDDFFFNSRCSSSAWSSSAGWGTSGASSSAPRFLAYLDREGLANIGARLNDHGRHVSIDVPKYEFGIFGIILVLTMLFRPEGLIPSSRGAGRVRTRACTTSRSTTSHDEPVP